MGDMEIKNKTANVRTRNNEVLGEKQITEFIKSLTEQVKQFK
ncbi:MAG TPA: hypothetical protein VK158_00170 [Acidobacteriota bacterium]|nr:hypothetical protein [Acidobacteriota bacterium]